MLKPLGHRVLVEVEKVKEKTDGGLIIPETAREREQMANTRGTVIALGSTAYLHPDFGGIPWVAVGDKIVFAKYGGVETIENDSVYRLLNDEDVLAKVEA